MIRSCLRAWCVPAMLSTACLATLLAGAAQAKSDPPRYAPFAPRASYALCFVPDGAPCDALLISTINATRRSLRIQAYSFTSASIAQAVKRAHDRGVDVQVIVDQSQVSARYSSATFLKNAGIPVMVDTRPAIAHNKVMIFDHRAVFTGSFNFTKAAQERNAENGILIRDDPVLVKAYDENWTTRFNVSSPY